MDLETGFAALIDPRMERFLAQCGDIETFRARLPSLLQWDESVHLLGSNAPQGRRAAAIEVIRRRVLGVLETLRSISDDGQTTLARHARNALQAIEEDARR